MPARPPPTLPPQQVAQADHTHARTAPGSVSVGSLDSTVYGTTTTAIDPDDTQQAGTAVTVSRSDHQHAFTSAVAAALTETTTSGEGVASTHARSDHVHSTAVLPWGLLGAPTTLTADSADTSGTTELDLALDQTVTTTTGRRVRLEFSCRNLLGNTQQDLFEIRFKENSTQVAAFRAQVHEATAHVDLHTCRHVYTPTAGSRTFEVFLVRVGGTGAAHVVAGSTFPAVFTVEDVG